MVGEWLFVREGYTSFVEKSPQLSINYMNVCLCCYAVGIDDTDADTVDTGDATTTSTARVRKLSVVHSGMPTESNCCIRDWKNNDWFASGRYRQYRRSDPVRQLSTISTTSVETRPASAPGFRSRTQLRLSLSLLVDYD